ncbi:uncharacterized protein Dwil_GK16313 [Drosophila willistoni]|uniref:pyridoxal 5'-phosphate synthase n=1 Tax=Drosophila willistoni TaxID=7260 RepID=B4N1I5_DROWI|nr:pyridoxine/pyridoxamine 5'-phosphate oxidase [Drosophila willistoni]EDW78224.1 uncharacterized protein Dwil_GK16313 [Drosophila willistoni]
MSSELAHIIDAESPVDPVELFKQLIETNGPDPLQTMNLATLDEEFGVLNRTVLYRGLTSDNNIFYITQRYTRNCKNLVANPKASLTFYLPNLKNRQEEATWQIRLLGAVAEELPDSELDALWASEQLPAQIRAYVCPCGEPVDYQQLKARHDNFLKEHIKNGGGKPIARPSSYTAFQFRPQRWDFLKVGVGQVADRLQYRRKENGKWQSLHVAT